ncbi:MAG: hypothetical protein LQ352_007386, partial [Teloschistes flavicans]
MSRTTTTIVYRRLIRSSRLATYLAICGAFESLRPSTLFNPPRRVRETLHTTTAAAMWSPDEDEDYKFIRALPSSPQTSQPTNSVGKKEIIVLDSDDDDETSTGSLPTSAPIEHPPSPSHRLKPGPPAPAMGMLGLDRKTMEQERLSRLKRKAPISPPPLARKAVRTEHPDQKSSSANTESNSSNLKVKSSDEASTTLPFANGIIKRTWAFGHDRDGQDIKLEEVLQKKDLQLAVLSSFQWDMDWLLAKIKTTQTHLVLVMQADTEEMKTQYRSDAADIKNLKICFPSMEGQINCMHSKLMLLSYPTHLRIAVPTANLVPYDWGETGTMENTLFLIDLPRLTDKTPVAADDTTEFFKDLIYFLRAQGLEKPIIDSLSRFDFSTTADLAFVHTIGGAHTGDHEPWRRTGYPGLSRAISHLNLNLSTNDPLEIDYLTSSIGSLNMDFLSTIYLAAHGACPLLEYNWRSKPRATNKNHPQSLLLAQNQASQRSVRDHVNEGFRIYFPSVETVARSKGGPDGAGTICFQRKWWEAATFPRALLRDCKARRGEGLVMHNKLIYVRPAVRPRPPMREDPATPHEKPKEKEAHEEKGAAAWCYIGSANLSESAWGRL